MTREAITKLKNGWKDRLKQIEGDLKCLKRQGLRIESTAKEYQYDILRDCLQDIDDLWPDEQPQKQKAAWITNRVPS